MSLNTNACSGPYSGMTEDLVRVHMVEHVAHTRVHPRPFFRTSSEALAQYKLVVSDMNKSKAKSTAKLRAPASAKPAGGTLDPRFRPLNRKKTKEAPTEDERFKTRSREFVTTAKVDLYGRPINRGDSDSPVSEVVSSSDEEEEEDVDHDEEEQDNNAREAIPEGQVTNRLAVVNLEWDQIRAEDLLVLFKSFLPEHGRIQSVAIYPSELGQKRMAEEKEFGPSIFARRAKASEDAEDRAEETADGAEGEGDDDDEEIDLFAEHRASSGPEAEAAKEAANEKLRQYELERLKYYYAIVTCDTKQTAEHLYRECDGREFEASSNLLDMRFVPDSTTFDAKPREVATKVSQNYKPPSFYTKALQQTKVELTWDRDDPRRRALKEQEAPLNDIEAFLASDNSDGEGSDAVTSASDDDDIPLVRTKKGKKKIDETKPSTGVAADQEDKASESESSDGKGKRATMKRRARAQFKDLLKDLGQTRMADKDMEVVFSSGLSGEQKLSDGSASEDEESGDEADHEEVSEEEGEDEAQADKIESVGGDRDWTTFSNDEDEKKAAEEKKNLWGFEKIKAKLAEKKRERRKHVKELKKQHVKKLKGRGGSDDEAAGSGDELGGNQMGADEEFDEDAINDPFFATPAKALGKGKKKASKDKGEKRKGKAGAEADGEEQSEEQASAKREAVLMADDEAPGEFDMKEITKSYQKQRKLQAKGTKKKSKAADDVPSAGERESDDRPSKGGDDFVVNVKDPRFQAVFESPEFAIDPTSSALQHKHTPNMERLLGEVQVRRAQQQKEQEKRLKNLKQNAKGPSSKPGNAPKSSTSSASSSSSSSSSSQPLSALVASVKRQSSQLTAKLDQADRPAKKSRVAPQ